MKTNLISAFEDDFMKLNLYRIHIASALRIGLFIVAIAGLLAAACSQNTMLYHEAQRERKGGDYEKAFFLLVESLINKPANAKAQELLKEVYPKAITSREDNLRRILASGDGDRYDRAVIEYTALEDMHIMASKLPTLRHPKTHVPLRVQIQDYSAALNDAKQNAAEYHYQKGLQYSFVSSDGEMQRNAAKEFKLAMDFVQDYKDARMYYEESRRMGVRRLAIIPFENPNIHDARYAATSELLGDLIIAGLLSDSESLEFLEIITRDKLDTLIREQQLGAEGLFDERSVANVGSLLGAHEILTGKITQILYSPPKTTRIREVETKNIRTGEEDYPDTFGDMKKRDVYEDVSCEYYKLTKNSKVVLAGSYAILEVATGKIKKQATFHEELPHIASWAIRGDGDERALSREVQTLIKLGEPASPSENEMTRDLVNRLAPQILSDIKDYLK